MYREKPSRILRIEDEYTAFCFDEACFYIQQMLEERDKEGNFVNTPTWADEANAQNNKDTIKWMQGP